jgi:hypothetical protein
VYKTGVRSYVWFVLAEAFITIALGAAVLITGLTPGLFALAVVILVILEGIVSVAARRWWVMLLIGLALITMLLLMGNDPFHFFLYILLFIIAFNTIVAVDAFTDKNWTKVGIYLFLNLMFASAYLVFPMYVDVMFGWYILVFGFVRLFEFYLFNVLSWYSD